MTGYGGSESSSDDIQETLWYFYTICQALSSNPPRPLHLFKQKNAQNECIDDQGGMYFKHF